MNPNSLEARCYRVVLAAWRFLRLKFLLNFILARMPASFTKWVLNKMELTKAVAGERFIPERDFEAKCREALLWLKQRSQGEALGDYLEFGVCHGTSMACMHRVTESLALSEQIRLIGFDSFQGLPDTTGMEDGHIWERGQCKANIRFSRKFLTKAGVNWKRTHLIPGWFTDTCTRAISQRFNMRRVSMILIDSDLYASAKTALEFCAPLIGDHAVILFDEWHIENFVEKNLGEKHAFDEFRAAHPEFEIEEFGQYESRSQCFKIARKKLSPIVAQQTLAPALSGGKEADKPLRERRIKSFAEDAVAIRFGAAIEQPISMPVKVEFWKNRRVFVTGHTGFKGSWLCLWLQSMGAEVIGYALNPPTKINLFELAQVGRGMTSVFGDVRDQQGLAKAIAEAQPEVVFHLAAQPLVRKSYANPIETYATNIMGTVHVLDAIRPVPTVRAVVMVTSDKCYENREWWWSYREKSALGGDDPYSSSKACAELIINAYRKSFFKVNTEGQSAKIASARAGNVIGGGDWAEDRLVPDILRSLLANETILIRNPSSTRPWQHVLEPLHGYLRLAEHLYHDGPRCEGSWNFGPGEANDKTVAWVVARLCDLWGGSAKWKKDTGVHPHENIQLKLDSSKARALLGWQPKLDLPTTLKWIVEWTQHYQNGSDMHAVTVDQILRFSSVPAGYERDDSEASFATDPVDLTE